MVLALAGDSTTTSFPDRLLVGFFFFFFLVEVVFFLDLDFGRFTISGLGKSSWACVEPLRYKLVPQTGQVPRVAGLPLAAHSGFGSCIGRFSRHFMQ